MKTVFNELCVGLQRAREPVTLATATQWLIELARLLNTLYGRYGTNVMRTKYGFSQLELFPGYSIGRALARDNSDISPSVRQIIKSRADRGQYLRKT